MAKIAKKLTDLIGNTPLLELTKFSEAKGLKTPVIAKIEYFNPGGSVKDRIALAMIEDAEQKGLLKPGATIIEPTSGNTGVGLALVAAVKGYKLILTMPETMSIERRNLVKAYGAEVRLTSGKDGMPGAIRAAEELRDSIPGSIILQQFENPANPAKHYATTGPEVWAQTDGKVDIFVAGVGTGGTVSGIAKYLKEQNPNIKVIAVEPKSSPVLNGGQSGPHKIQGIGAGFVPKTYDASVIDEVFDVENGRFGMVGFRIDPRFWNEGICTEAMKRVVDFIFAETEMDRLQGDANVKNTGSNRVLEKSGFRLEGTIRHGKMVSEYCDYNIWGMIRDDTVK